MGLIILFFFILLTSVAAKDIELSPCTAFGPDNTFYDLSSLFSKDDYGVLSEVGQKNMSINVCGAVNTELWNLNEPQKVGGFYRGGHGDVSIGQVNTTISISHGHPLIVLADGSACQIRNGDKLEDVKLPRSTLIRFICDQSVHGRGVPKLVSQLPLEDDTACAYFIEWRTHIACATHPPGGSWNLIVVFLTVVFIALCVYVIAAILYNRMVHGYRGWEQFASLKPTSSWLSSAKALFASGRQDQQRREWGSWGRDRSYFSSIPSDEEEAIMAGESWLDEQDEGARDNHLLDSDAPPQHGMGADGVIRL